jgi:hypothetical protein
MTRRASHKAVRGGSSQRGAAAAGACKPAPPGAHRNTHAPSHLRLWQLAAAGEQRDRERSLQAAGGVLWLGGLVRRQAAGSHARMRRAPRQPPAERSCSTRARWALPAARRQAPPRLAAILTGAPPLCVASVDVAACAARAHARSPRSAAMGRVLLSDPCGVHEGGRCTDEGFAAAARTRVQANATALRSRPRQWRQNWVGGEW